MLTTRRILVMAAAGLVFAGCAGSPPDFSDRTLSATAKQNELAQWLAQSSASESVTSIVAPVCSSTVGHPPTGWAIDAGSWCAVACPVKPENNKLDRWMLTSDGLRCYATDSKPTQLITTDFQVSQWKLEDQLLLRGFDRSFVSDTEWNCVEQEYQIDPDSNRGFWVDLKQPGNVYRFYDDGALMVGRAGMPVRFAGDWRGGANSSGVIVNDREMFKFAVNYGGGRFDEFKSATRKQICRFIDHPQPRA